ncbi:MAG: anti-sigma factor [Pseudomonadota bacterium]
MDCRLTLTLLDSHLDGELDVVNHLELERHLAACPSCRDASESRRALSATVRTHAPYHAAPVAVTSRIRAAFARTDSNTRAAFKPSPWLNLAASVTFAAVMGSGVTYWLAQPSPHERLTQEVFAGHVRSLLVTSRSTDVSSSDQHTVKPWFNGRLDFSPPVVDLTGRGFPLVGGRLDYLSNRPVAALVYRHRQHAINLFVWPGASGANNPPQTRTHQGYHIVHWTSAGMNFWAVSDLNPADLLAFSGLVREHTVSP